MVLMFGKCYAYATFCVAVPVMQTNLLSYIICIYIYIYIYIKYLLSIKDLGCTTIPWPCVIILNWLRTVPGWTQE